MANIVLENSRDNVVDLDNVKSSKLYVAIPNSSIDHRSLYLDQEDIAIISAESFGGPYRFVNLNDQFTNGNSYLATRFKSLKKCIREMIKAGFDVYECKDLYDAVSFIKNHLECEV